MTGRVVRAAGHRRYALLAVCVASAVLGLPAQAGSRQSIVGSIDAAVSPTSTTIAFRTSVGAKATLELGTDETYGLRRRETGAARFDHRFVVGGLRPATTYRYRVTLATAAAAVEGTLDTDVIRPQPAGVRGRAILLDGSPFFPLMTWAQCAEDVETNLTLGVNVFMGYSPCGPDAERELVLATTGRALTLLPLGGSGGTLGWHQPDEPDGYGIPPDQLALPPDPAQTGKLTFLTVTAHFSNLDGQLPFGREVYRDYFARADVVGFDYYTFGKECNKPYTGLQYTFDEQRELTKLVGKPTFQWIETGPLEGACMGNDRPQLTPERLAAEIWLAIAGGATGLGYFTHSWPAGEWLRSEVAEPLAREIGIQNARIAALQPALLSEQLTVGGVGGTGPIRASARRYGGSIYVIVVNATEAPVTASFKLRLLRVGTRLEVLRENRFVKVRKGWRVVDRFAPLQVRVYRTT